MNTAEDIKGAIDIFDVGSFYTTLQRRGDKSRGCCPIHNGSNPTSFVTDSVQGRARCMSCGFWGDHFDIVARMEGVSFTEACDIVAERYGISSSPTFEQRRESLKLAQTEMRAFSSFLAITRTACHREIRRLQDLRNAALCFIGLLDEMEHDENEERRAITAEGCRTGEQVEVAGNPLLASDIRDQLANLHDSVTKATQKIDEIEALLDRTHFEPEAEVEGFLRRYYAVPELREALAV